MHTWATLTTAAIILSLVCICTALECYVCTDQEHNDGKCTRSIKTCEQGEDVCLTEIRWGSMPYWQQGGLKQHYISKRCATKEYCEQYRYSNMRLCTHIWYEDWKCSDCCKGDRCNYYIISDGSYQTIAASALLISGATLLLLR